jgi:hypothetical protein
MLGPIGMHLDNPRLKYPPAINTIKPILNKRLHAPNMRQLLANLANLRQLLPKLILGPANLLPIPNPARAGLLFQLSLFGLFFGYFLFYLGEFLFQLAGD